MPRLSAKAVVDKAAGSKPASRRGGARAGAGRKTKKQKNQSAITAAEVQIKDRLPELIENLLQLAFGGYEVIAAIYEPAGMILIDHVDFTDDGKAVKTKALAYPDLPPEQMVLVKQIIKIKDKDRKANEYLVDRIMGRPQQPIKFEDLDDEDLLSKIKELAGGSASPED